MKTHPILSIASALACAASPVMGQSTIDGANSYAWSANTGWINFRPSVADGVVTGGKFLSGYSWDANTGWIHMGDGTPVNGHTYANTSATDYGVNHDGAGNLTGFAYSANTGWVNFGWAGLNDPNRPHFSIINGNFSGYAWGANTGWINLGAGLLNTDQILCLDTDRDGMGDAWEMQHFGNLVAAGIGTDKDNDGQSDAAEYAADTNPNDPGESLRFASHTYTTDFSRVTLQFATTRPTRLYRIQGSTTLLSTGPGAWTDVGGLGTFAADPGSTTEKRVALPPGTARHFLRIVPVKPLQP